MTSYAVKITLAASGALIGALCAGGFLLAAYLAPGGSWPIVVVAACCLALFGVSAWFGASTLSAETERDVEAYYRQQADQRISDARPARPQRPALPADVDRTIDELGALLEDGLTLFQRLVEKNGALRSQAGSLAEYLDGVNRDRAQLREEVTRARRAVAVWNGEAVVEKAAPPRRPQGPEEYAPAFLRRNGAAAQAPREGELEADIAAAVRPAPPEAPAEG
jgi:hypothetical protein